MFRFEKEQQVLDIAGVKVGGQPGEYPTVLVGSIFYDRHKIVSNEAKGEFDKKQAELLINKVKEMSEKTKNPFFLDVVANTPEALIKYVDYISSATDCPFFIDGPSPKVRIPATKHAMEIGLRERAIYNSIDYLVTDEEAKALRNLNVKNAVVMAFTPKKPLTEGRVDILRGYPGQKGLLRFAEEAGVKNTLVDTAVTDVPGIGIAAKAIHLVKKEFGLPTGCGPANAVTQWKRLKKGEFGQQGYNVCSGGSGIVTQMMGANFVLFGPIELSESAFIACAMTDAITAYTAKRMGTTIKATDHPLYNIF
ncbi:MAG: tetrahydromethanopterin S-methyltransferase subunit H [Candidatus Atabeyarchaeum deiterrae]